MAHLRGPRIRSKLVVFVSLGSYNVIQTVLSNSRTIKKPNKIRQWKYFFWNGCRTSANCVISALSERGQRCVNTGILQVQPCGSLSLLRDISSAHRGFHFVSANREKIASRNWNVPNMCVWELAINNFTRPCCLANSWSSPKVGSASEWNCFSRQ